MSAAEDVAIARFSERVGHPVERKGFLAFVRKLYREDPDVENPGYIDRFHLLPDGWYQLEDEQIVVAVEHTLTSRLTDRRLRAYADLFWCIDETGWQLCVVNINTHGQSADVPLSVWYRSLEPGWDLETLTPAPKP